MRLVTLFSSIDGRFEPLAEVLVSIVPVPEVVIWRSRVFKQCHTGEYVEVIACLGITPDELRNLAAAGM